MSAPPRALILALLVLGTADGADVPAEPTANGSLPPSVPRATAASGTHPIFAPPPEAPPPAPRRRLISPKMAAQLAAAIPRDTIPAEPVSTPPLSGFDEGPEHGILRLPRYIVEADRVPKLKDRELYSTPEARIAAGMKAHPGLRIGNLPFLNNHAVAAEMIDQERTLERRRELAELSGMLPTNPGANRNQVKSIRSRATQGTTWSETGGSYAQQKR